MPTVRLTKPLAGIPVGEDRVVTIPAGTLIERDPFLERVGLITVLLEGKRITVSSLDFDRSSELVESEQHR
jgi:hypothetical protein